MTDLMELASRVEAGEGRDKDLEAAIHQAVFGTSFCHPLLAPPTTVSLDASEVLVLIDECWRVGHDADDSSGFMAQCSYTPEPGKMGFIVGRGITAARALTAAALRARAHQGAAHVDQ